MSKTECAICGVAYDMGYKHCMEVDCLKLCRLEHPKLRKDKREPYIVKIYPHKPVVKDPAYSRHQSVIARAKKKNLECSVTVDDIRELIKSNCVYCGATERIEIDRKDSSLGYTVDNTCSACRRCNTIKNDVVSYREMIEIAKMLRWTDV